MPRRSSIQYSSEDEKFDLGSDLSSTMRENDALLIEEVRHKEDAGVYPVSVRRFVNWRAILFVLNILLFITGVSVWIHVVVLSKNFRCDKGPQEDRFEPDCMLKTNLWIKLRANDFS